MNTEIAANRGDGTKPSFRVEFIAGLSTYLTLSYIFLLNPILLSKAGINISAGFFATVVSATLSTLLMGYWAKVPFAVAPAPSITTFFVSYVCVKMGLSWQAALAAVVVSGVLSWGMAILSMRQKLIAAIPDALRVGVVLAVSGFLIANGLTQGKVISHAGGFIDVSKLSVAVLGSPGAIVLYVGLIVALLFRLPAIRFSGAALLGILAASITAAMFGIKATTKAEFSWDMFSAVFRLDFRPLFDPRFSIAILVFFIIDFFGGVGKYVGLFKAMGPEGKAIEERSMGAALKVDGVGNIIGGVLGASSLAVFVSSAVGIVAGGRTGTTAKVTAGFMAATLFVFPLVGAIPVEATSGILVYVGFLLIPYADFGNRSNALTVADKFWCLLAAIVSFLTYGIDKAILLVFVVYSVKSITKGEAKSHAILIAVTVLLLAAVVAQWLL